jgi:protein gp37/ParB-like chromosome segregation protein Spo0J
MIQQISLDLIDAHPDNPRIVMREGVIEAIQAQLRGNEFDEMHAILLRPIGEGRFQILDGHHRVEAARREKLESVPAWVREYTDEEAFMQLALANAQSGLTALERGRHALAATTRYGANGGLSIAKYAERVARKDRTVHNEVWAYEVYESADVGRLDGCFSQLVAIHAAPRETWAKLAQQMIDQGWTVEQTEAAARAARAAEKKASAPVIASVRLEEWKKLKQAARKELLNWRPRLYQKHFNRQDSDSIEWAQWSWNPVTGCLHNCPYCYARDIAERFYPEKFEPVLHMDRLVAPSATSVPPIAAQDISMKNVFTCSMADLFGQWVPREWIEAVLEVVAENPQWNFLFLTKFPIRMAEFEYPPNAWLGTSVDLQARVKNAERAMAKVRASVKWLSLEPLIEPLVFEDLSAFQWVVIGGASPSNQTPEWKPPRRWVWDLTMRAMDAGCLVYHKTNLPNDRLKMFPGDAQKEAEAAEAPAAFHYLKVLP